MDDWMHIDKNTNLLLSECACDPKNITVRDANNPICIFPSLDSNIRSESQNACHIWKQKYDSSTQEEKENNTQHCICK